ncbi:MAG TPA: ABC transporter permease subunit [Nocardioidaceae bacterium]|nr:ABC transporter permease subunit [Nocardioidaceae bacterium]
MKLGSGVLVRYVLLALANALGVYALMVLGDLGMWKGFAAVLAGTLAVDVVYATKRFIPMKYLLPGLVLLLVYQVYVVLYTGAVALTNSSEFNQGTEDRAVSVILAQNELRVPDSPQYRLTVLDKDGRLAFLVTDPDGDVFVGTSEQPLEETDDATLDDTGKAIGLEGYTTLPYAELVGPRSKEITSYRVPFSDDPTAGSLKTQDGSNAYVYKPAARYDAAAGTITRDGVTYTADDDTGYFVSPEGDRLTPGWKVNVGFDNFTRILTNKEIRGPFLAILVWTIVFAAVTVLGTFALGLLTAIVLNDPRMRFRRWYRSLLLMPYAIPAIISAGVFKGMLNTQFGFVNDVLLFGAHLDWLGDPWLAKVSLVLVNLWLGYPYMFLVSTGALQAIPSDVVEAATVDGASAWNVFRFIKLPFILVATAPLLIASYAFNFNNYTLVAALTNGGPPMTSADVSAGHTDILITFVYELAFGGEQAQYGFASAISILIFVFVGAISVLGFRQTRRFEEMS